MIEFQAWPKTSRLFRDIVVTEKLDGTNAAIIITEDGEVGAQSRTRIITPGKTTDNYGFAGWVEDNAFWLAHTLGPGRHFGEWWGQGIQRRYGMEHRQFSLFNTEKWAFALEEPLQVGTALLGVVPVMYRGPFSEGVIEQKLQRLVYFGSQAAPGWMKPEGVCVYHTQSKRVYKVTLDDQDKGKWSA